VRSVDDTLDVRCLSCGAPIESRGASRCGFCGSALPTREVPAIGLIAPASVWTPVVNRPLLIWYAAIAAVGALVCAVWAGGAARRSSTSARSRERALAERQVPRIGVANLLSTIARGGGAYDLVVSLENAKGVGLFDGRVRSLRWTHGPFDRTIEPDRVAIGDNSIYIAEESRITSLRLADGALEWQTSFATEIGSSCPGCFMVLKDRVIALQRDGSLQVFDAVSGRLAWSLSLANTPSQLQVANDLIAVTQPVAGDRNELEISLLDPTGGRRVAVLTPSCIDKTFHRRERPSLWSPVVVGDDRMSVYVLFGIFSHCIQAWDVPAAKMRWNAYVPELELHAHAVVGEGLLVFNRSSHELTVVNTATGKVSDPIGEPQHKLEPLHVSRDTVVASAAPDWDRHRVALWGLDAASGERRWQFAMSSRKVGLEDTWSTNLGQRGLSVLQEVDAGHVALDLLDLRTGVSSGQRVLAIGPHSSTLLATFRDDIAWIPVFGGLQAVSLPSGTLAYHVP
jgi:outer membrane protein assembly factor BamB